MKFAATMLSVLALAMGLTAFKVPLEDPEMPADDLQDTLSSVPINVPLKIVNAYLVQDNKFKSSLDILESRELNAFVKDIEASPALNDLAHFVNETVARRNFDSKDTEDSDVSVRADRDTFGELCLCWRW